jgi:hypothetical protein
MECRTTAIARGEPNGIWGGLTELQRRRMRKAEKRRKINEESYRERMSEENHQ